MHSLLLLLSLAASTSELSDNCALSVYAVMPDGEIAPEATLKPKDVLSVEQDGVDVSGSQLWSVKLTADGASINSRFTKDNLGTRMAIFCGESEISRLIIVAPSTSEFMFSYGLDEP